MCESDWGKTSNRELGLTGGEGEEAWPSCSGVQPGLMSASHTRIGGVGHRQAVYLPEFRAIGICLGRARRSDLCPSDYRRSFRRDLLWVAVLSPDGARTRVPLVSGDL